MPLPISATRASRSWWNIGCWIWERWRCAPSLLERMRGGGGSLWASEARVGADLAGIASQTNATQTGTAHGRQEERPATVIADSPTVQWRHHRHQWPGLLAIARIHAQRRFPDGPQPHETRLYRLSRVLRVMRRFAPMGAWKIRGMGYGFWR